MGGAGSSWQHSRIHQIFWRIPPRFLTLKKNSTKLQTVIDNPTNLVKNISGCAGLVALSSQLPDHAELGLDAALLEPIREFLSRESKQVRAQLVRIGFSLATTASHVVSSNVINLLECLGCLVESLHAGSLLIDDIQDLDEMRRGKTSLYLEIGVPRTINAANWLYFWPTESLRQQAIAPAIELEIYRIFHKTMIRAHEGQALDLGHNLTLCSQSDAHLISIATIEQKTGELMAMCAELGAIAGGADIEIRSCLAKFGRRFGVALQMFNDIGEVSQNRKDSDKIRPMIKPSWVWAVGAEMLQPSEFVRFQRLMAGYSNQSSITDDGLLSGVMQTSIERAVAEIEACMDDIRHLVQSDEQRQAHAALRELAQKVKCAYA